VHEPRTPDHAAQVADHVAFYVEKHRDRNVPWLINRKLLISKQFERPPRTVVVYSDLHGSYEKFVVWLKQGLGYIRLIVREILGRWYSDDVNRLYARLILLENRSRIGLVDHVVRDPSAAEYQPKLVFSKPIPALFKPTLDALEAKGIRRTRVIEDLLMVLREVTLYDEHRAFKVAPEVARENLMTLYLESPQQGEVRRALVRSIVGSDDIYLLMTDMLARLIDLCIVDKHVNLGDTLDRGDAPDHLLKLYRTYFDRGAFSPFLHYIWGNHDILWLGASLGNAALVATALRVSLRYSNFAFCRRYGFDLSRLRAHALATYPDRPTGSYAKRAQDPEWSEDEILKMTKALLVIESKLAASESRAAALEDSAFQAEYAGLADHYEALLGVLPTGVASDAQASFLAAHPLYTDCFFPTVDPAEPSRLTPDEQAVMDDLVDQFVTLPRFQEDMQYLFWKGESYRVVDDTLYFHAAIPATPEGGFQEVGGLKGKALFDHLQREIKRIGDKHRALQPLTPAERHLLFFLWCGPTSPLFCKSKMATLERAVLAKEPAAERPLTTWKEDKNPFYRNIRSDDFINRALAEFHARTLCMGHTPVKDLEEGILSENLTAFIVDGGASDAYGDRGTVLIRTPEASYLTLNPSMGDLRAADDATELYDPVIEKLQSRHGSRLAETETGYFMKAELEAIHRLLERHLPAYMRRHVEP